MPGQVSLPQPVPIIRGVGQLTNPFGITQAIPNLANSAATLVSLLHPNAVIGVQPQDNVAGVGLTLSFIDKPILFHYEGENSSTLQTDITDHFVEDNTAIQDQMALRPIEISTHGFIGELNDIPVLPQLAIAKAVASSLNSAVGAFVPGLSTTALITYNQAAQAAAIASTVYQQALSAMASINGSQQTDINGIIFQSPALQNLQQQFYQRFLTYYVNRTLFTVQTPWAVYQNMAIKSLRAIQDDSTRMVTDFEVTFKQMRFASTRTSGTSSSILQGRASAQQAPQVIVGATTPPVAATA